MAPVLDFIFQRRDFNTSTPADAFSQEWSQPSNYAFTILLLLGGDLINRALAQLAGGWITPVAFSFGWVSYATASVCAALGEYRLMPSADTGCCIINGKNGYVRGNNSWVLGRMMRDYEYWMGKTVADKTESLIETRWKFEQEKENREYPGSNITVPRPAQAGLVVSIWKPSQKLAHGEPGHDILHWSGLIVTVIQLGVACIPLGLTGDWGVLLITGGATLLCYFTGALQQWKIEKWACRRLDGRSNKNFVMTRGNGAQHAIAIISDGHGLDLEDLATGFANVDSPTISLFSQLSVIVLGILWVALLITASGLTDDSWYLIAVGGIGMLQNIFVAGWKRTPDAYGIPLEFVDVIGEAKVMNTLMELEKRYEKLGKSMLGTFFPGDLRENEIAQWAAIAAEWKEKKDAVKPVEAKNH
ncbi:Hypothetical protein PENO1_027650 [Penicillium occitanis (nom. inval.)]|nr:Hypothetical protein PENO1_027650 [Penicillium occitanis (nom. inval.)]PCH09725.1 hypothetical protein PENOC_008430 [Penicillium occitanis (nom. inval.)]